MTRWRDSSLRSPVTAGEKGMRRFVRPQRPPYVLAMSKWLLAACLSFAAGVGCRGSTDAALGREGGSDAATDTEDEEDTLAPLPTLDPSKCGVFPEETIDRGFAFAKSGSTLEDKAFPFSAELHADAATMTELREDATLAAMERTRAERLGTARDCADLACIAAATAWSDAELTTAGDAMLMRLGGRLAPLASRLRASGMFALHAAITGEGDDAALVRAAFADDARAAAKAIADYAMEVPKDARDTALSAGLPARPLAFFEPTLLVALALLAADGRDEATRYEPLADGENAEAKTAIATIDWGAYPFTAIVVPGQGPTNHETALSEGSRIRADLAAQRWRAKVAPLIVPSGGHVHPERAKYSEAIEIKRYLVQQGIPASAIVVDPHARHTTTNLRNASRLLLRYGVPSARPVLVTSDLGQTLYMIGRPFAVRCQKEIGYEPWRKLVSLSTTDTCIFMSARSLHVDARDVLDP